MRPISHLIMLISALFLSFATFAQEQNQAWQNDGLALQYLVRQPLVKSDHMPIIILIHGRGGDERSLFSRADQLPKEALIIAPRGPLALGGDAYAWYHVTYGGDAPAPNPEEAEQSRLTLTTFIKQITEKYKGNPTHVYLMGFSQGGAMTLSLGLTHPELVKVCVALSGRVLDEIQPKIAAKEQLKNLSIFMGHGTADKLLPVKYARDNRSFLEKQNIKLSYHEYDMGHEIVPQEMKDVQDWLRKELRGK